MLNVSLYYIVSPRLTQINFITRSFYILLDVKHKQQLDSLFLSLLVAHASITDDVVPPRTTGG